ncbi:hypothetical protein N7508_005879 [Penicillium antarcticum]|uniref:uncharacterized protein n=1 Tax=Penicillium antarcticum TaxID=416450 RepID=UPI00238698DB|nr:uncharacterized protein N7508_005879 [Penicillium antarcticum]KAJ5306864.1 hypothetical protein N7508_005879 [Penicillium antarcticum]
MDKVLGVLPDYAEYLGLLRLNQMCLDIKECYSPGAEVTIAADGVVFNDLLMISDDDVWNYGQAVREMVQKHGFDQNLKVLHAMEILSLTMTDPTTKSTTLTEEIFHKTIASSRAVIISEFCQSENVTQKLVDEDIDSRLTYNGMKAFVKIDLANTSIRKNAASKKDYHNEISSLALKMMGRSEGFGKLIRTAMPHHVRLSIHPSYGTAKLSICLVPQLSGFTARAPWMSCIAVDRQGANHTAHARDVRVTHQLVVENGMPWMFMERAAAPLPEWLLLRNQMFEELWQQNLIDLKKQPRKGIKITIEIDGRPERTVDAMSWLSTPKSLLAYVSEELRNSALIAKINGRKYWDLNRPFEEACSVAFLGWDHPEGQQALWRSCANCLAELCEQEFQCVIADTMTSTRGFYCEMSTLDGRGITETDRELLTLRMMQVVQKPRGFDRLELPRHTLQKIFASNKYRLHAINRMAEGQTAIIYRSGTYVDLAYGPHIPDISLIKAFRATQSSSAYFLGDQNESSLQRVSGIAFPHKGLMNQHLQALSKLQCEDHIRLGKQQQLFLTHELSPGSPFLLPHGVRIFNALQKLLRAEYHTRGYQEVQTPNMYDATLWKTSGHWAHYKEDMFRFNLGKKEWALKPMNCPGHFLLFTSRDRTFRELPLRYADFGVLHRNEASGALRGLTRVRKFQQDDAHIICRPDQIVSEVEAVFDLLKSLYGLFDFTFKLALSTRPAKFLGTIETWNEAEDQLREALTRFKCDDWTINPGDGAFYGPKIDITIADSLGRELQCATIQLDYQAPINFNMKYTTEKVEHGIARPVVIHRAIFGSFERFLGILIEHFAGNWPFWLSPRQVLIVPVSDSQHEYAKELERTLQGDKMHVDLDLRDDTLRKKVLRGHREKYNFIFVVGPAEEKTRTVNIRNRDKSESQHRGTPVAVDEVRLILRDLRKRRRLANTL